MERKNSPPFSIEPINGDTWRPGMPDEGYLVRYRLHPQFGWTRCHVCATKGEAEAFAATLEEEQ